MYIFIIYTRDDSCNFIKVITSAKYINLRGRFHTQTLCTSYIHNTIRKYFREIPNLLLNNVT